MLPLLKSCLIESPIWSDTLSVLDVLFTQMKSKGQTVEVIQDQWHQLAVMLQHDAFKKKVVFMLHYSLLNQHILFERMSGGP